MFFGKKAHQTFLQDIRLGHLSKELLQTLSDMSLEGVVALRQIHSSKGLLLNRNMVQQQPVSLFEHEGDFIVTELKNVALLSMTADCAAIILHDCIQQVVAIVHAGWRGSVLGVVLKALSVMISEKKSQKHAIKVYFAASAQACCYEVAVDFRQHFVQYPYADKAFIKKNNKLYFDNKLFLKLQLKNFGIDDDNIYDLDTTCTICDTSYCSFRRDKEQAGRQATLVALV